MGGPRCIFRDCPVSTQRNPNMHFFKLPTRDQELLLTWLKYCDKIEILKLTESQQKNRAVCARHFRNECFMNYKLDRLIPNQAPTLVRISKELAFDLEHLDENGEATLLKIQTPALSHLIPPADFECPLGFDSDAPALSLPLQLKGMSGAEQRTTSAHGQRARKRASSETTDRDLVTKLNKFSTKEDVNNPINVVLPIQVNKACAPGECEPLAEEPSSTDLADLQHKHDHLIAKYDQLWAKHLLVEQSKADLEAKCAALEQTRASLSKPQIFNAIRKYLGPTMTALLRMDMFGSMERAWQVDEQQFAVELLQMGENFYKHCSEEWRFRLPALQQARDWLKNHNRLDAEQQNP